MRYILVRLIELYSLVVIAAVVVSWFGVSPRQPVVQVLHSLTEPLLQPIRRVVPPLGGLDFSPMVLLLALQLLIRLI